MRDLRDMSAREAGGIASGDFSSAEVLEHFVGRLREVNGKLNAVTADSSGSARKGAADVDKARAGECDRPVSRDAARESERGSAGLPIAVQVIARPWRDLSRLPRWRRLNPRRGKVQMRKSPDYAERQPL
jgi:Asp-tRNA(Asn)/Glu-tRNA(Gln) amidotransferase A subunit family amidase